MSAALDEVPGIEDIDDDCVEILAARNLNFWRSDLTDNCSSDSCSRDCGAGVSAWCHTSLSKYLEAVVSICVRLSAMVTVLLRAD